MSLDVYRRMELSESTKLRCPDCGSKLLLKHGGYGMYWGCETWIETGCKGSMGAHPDGTPLGVPAGKKTKKLRIEAHGAFDQLWKAGGMSRKQAYNWMQKQMGLGEDQAHIGKFNEDQCQELIILCSNRDSAPTEEIPASTSTR